MSVNITWCTSLACCCTAPTHCCPPNCTRCSTPPTPWHLGTPPRTRPPRCRCSWWAQLCQEATGYLPTRTRTHRFTFCSCNTFPSELQLWHVACMNACMWCVPLTELVPDGGGLGRVRGLADAGGVAAADAEAVGLPLSEVEQGEAGRLDWDLGVHPLPAVCARDTLGGRKLLSLLSSSLSSSYIIIIIIP